MFIFDLFSILKCVCVTKSGTSLVECICEAASILFKQQVKIIVTLLLFLLYNISRNIQNNSQFQKYKTKKYLQIYKYATVNASCEMKVI